MTDNLYDLIRASAPADPAAPLLETPDGQHYAWGDLERLTGQLANALAARGRRPRRPGRGPGGEEPGGGFPLPCLPARGRGLSAAQHRLHAGRARLFLRRRRAGRDRLRPGAGRRHRGPRQCGRRAGPDPRCRGPGLAQRCRRGGAPERVRNGRARRRRSRRDPLHLGHHRARQGRDAEPRQSRLERADPARRPGASPRRTCCCTCCRSTTPTACSWRSTRRSWPAPG